MSEENPFASSDSFEEVEEQVIDTQPTEDELLEKGFNEGLNEIIVTDEIVDEQATEEIEKLIAGMTEAELKAALDKINKVDEINDRLSKTHDRVFGKIGQLEQTFKQMAEQRQEIKRQELTKDNFKNLSEWFENDDAIEAFVKDFNSINLGGTTEVKVPEIDYSGFDNKLSEIKNTFETKLLYMAHPDWFELTVKEYDESNNPVYTDDFAAWKKSLPKEGQDILDTSTDGLVLAKAYTEFKQWRSKKTDHAEKKQQRLEDSVRPTGTGSSITKQEKSVENSFRDGLREALGRR